MRLNNQKIKGKVVSVYFLLAVVLVFLFISFDFVKAILVNAKFKYVILLFLLSLIFYFFRRAAKYFEYDSDGNVLVFVNKGIMLSDFFNYRENRAEFPKEKLLYYKLNNYSLYKSLNIYISSNKDKQKRLKFNVSLVSKKKLKYLKQSLDKVIKQNKSNG